MELVDPDPQRLDARDLIVRERSLSSVALAGVFSALALGWTVGPWMLGSAPPWGRAFASGLIGLPLSCVALALLQGASRALRTERWTLRVGANDLWLCPRSCLNQARDRAPARWIRAPLCELVGARAGEQRTHLPDGDGGATLAVERWLELEFSGNLPAAVVEAVARERNQRRGTRFLAFPLEVRGERRLRVQWQTQGLSLAPSREAVLAALPEYVRGRQAPQDVEVDSALLSSAGTEDLARDLHRRGRTMDAVRLLRARHDWSLGRVRAWLLANEDRAA